MLILLHRSYVREHVGTSSDDLSALAASPDADGLPLHGVLSAESAGVAVGWRWVTLHRHALQVSINEDHERIPGQRTHVLASCS